MGLKQAAGNFGNSGGYEAVLRNVLAKERFKRSG
jgi:hypothetical protein